LTHDERRLAEGAPVLAAMWTPPVPGTAPALGGRLPVPRTGKVGGGHVVVMGGARGAIAGETVAAQLAADGLFDRCAWLRVEPALRDSALLGHALVQAVRRRNPAAALALSQRLASRVLELDAVVAAVSRASDGPSVVVLEDTGRGRSSHVIARLAAAWAKWSGPPLVVLVHGRVPRSLRRWSVPVPVLGAGTAEASPLSPSTLYKLTRLTGGRGTVAADIVAATGAWAGTDVGRMIDGAHTLAGLLTRVSEHLVEGASPAVLSVLTSAARLGSWHSRFGEMIDVADGESDATDPGARLRPWLVPLEDGWYAVRPVWWRPLARALERAAGRRQYADDPALGRPRSADAAAWRTTPAIRPAPVDDQAAGTGAQAGLGDKRCVVRVRLLGDFELIVDGRPVTAWHGHLGPALVKYLLAQPKRACARDVLLEQFWPGVEPDVARNRLHVALSSVRRALAALTDAPLVEFSDGFYRIGPAHDVETDVDQFHALIEAGRSAEIGDRLDDAAALYRRAAATYAGDFLADCPYDDWTMLRREELRMAYLDLLDRWSGVLDAAGRNAECIEVGRLVLRQDPCREDVHRLIMRCQACFGRTSEALRQYERCRRALRDTLGLEPSAPTQALARSLREPAHLPTTPQLSYSS
jgi:DNA-binding SARP family transcriptional activator